MIFGYRLCVQYIPWPLCGPMFTNIIQLEILSEQVRRNRQINSNRKKNICPCTAKERTKLDKYDMLATINALIQKSIYVEFIKISIGGGIESNGGDTNIGQHQHRHQNIINSNGDNTNGPPAVDEKDGFVKLPSPTPTSSPPTSKLSLYHLL